LAPHPEIEETDGGRGKQPREALVERPEKGAERSFLIWIKLRVRGAVFLLWTPWDKAGKKLEKASERTHTEEHGRLSGSSGGKKKINKRRP